MRKLTMYQLAKSALATVNGGYSYVASPQPSQRIVDNPELFIKLITIIGMLPAIRHWIYEYNGGCGTYPWEPDCGNHCDG